MAESQTSEPTPIKTSRNPKIQDRVDQFIRDLSKKRKGSPLKAISDEARDKTATDITLRGIRDELKEAKANAMTDKLTALPNRAWMEDYLEKRAAKALRTGKSFKIAIYDLDRFKWVNDGYGHNAGDKVLQATAELPRRAEEPIARWGGEELLGTIEEDTEKDNLIHIFSRQMESMREKSEMILSEIPFSQKDDAPPQIPYVTMSIGVADYIPGVTSLEDAIEAADKALYEAKSTTRNTVVYANRNVDASNDQDLYTFETITNGAPAPFHMPTTQAA